MTTVLLKKLEAIGSEANWRKLPIDVLEEHFVEPLFDLPEEDMIELVSSMSQQTFDFFRMKLWTVQDMPEEEDGYNKTVHIMTVLKRLLLFRIPVTDDASKRASLTQQLAHISLILSPTLIATALANKQQQQQE